jgi:hypothetical protein
MSEEAASRHNGRFVVLFLVGILLWHWWPSDEKPNQPSTQSNAPINQEPPAPNISEDEEDAFKLEPQLIPIEPESIPGPAPPVYVPSYGSYDDDQPLTDDQLRELESDAEDWCQTAESDCESECSYARPSLETDDGDEIEDDDHRYDDLVFQFRQNCEEACQSGQSACVRDNSPDYECSRDDSLDDCRSQLQDTICTAFKNDCDSDCPYGYGYSAQSACEDACDSGKSTCDSQ